MKTNIITRTSADIIENTLRPWDVWELNRYLQSIALPDAIAEARKNLSFSMESTLWSFDAELGEVSNDLAARADSAAGRRLAALLAAKDVLDACPELPSITAKLDPIFADLQRARAHEEQSAADKLKAKRALEAARQAAEKRLLAEVDADPEVVAARQKMKQLAVA
jgi:hypothetical protein